MKAAIFVHGSLEALVIGLWVLSDKVTASLILSEAQPRKPEWDKEKAADH